MDPIYQVRITVPVEAVDGNRHANNVAYVKWMQDAAVEHAAATGCTARTRELGATWVVHGHRIEYLKPAFLNDEITITTWVANFRKVRSLRRYRFLRNADQTVVAEGETDWVFVDARSGRPRPIPEEIKQAFGVQAEDPPT